MVNTSLQIFLLNSQILEIILIQYNQASFAPMKSTYTVVIITPYSVRYAVFTT